MLNARIELAGTTLKCSNLDCPGAKSSVIYLPPDWLERLRRWAADYDRAVRAKQPDKFPAIGRDIAACWTTATAGWNPASATARRTAEAADEARTGRQHRAGMVRTYPIRNRSARLFAGKSA